VPCPADVNFKPAVLLVEDKTKGDVVIVYTRENSPVV